MQIDIKVVDKINKMSRYEMCELWRNAPIGHIYFDVTLPYFKIFKNRFNNLGGFSPEISKKIGFDSVI